MWAQLDHLDRRDVAITFGADSEWLGVAVPLAAQLDSFKVHLPALEYDVGRAALCPSGSRRGARPSRSWREARRPSALARPTAARPR